MGSLNLPDSGTVYIDAQTAIYTVERHPTYAPMLQPLWVAVQAGRLRVATSELCMLESLVIPYRRADAPLIETYERFFGDPGVDLIPVSRQILLAAAQLRAVARVKTPDAIHWATAQAVGVELFVTNDRDFSGKVGLPIALLADLSTE